MIELLFKQIKQNFPLRYFWGESSNAVKMQVYCVLIAQLLMVIIRKKAAAHPYSLLDKKQVTAGGKTHV